jgi:hypothetical protein
VASAKNIPPLTASAIQSASLQRPEDLASAGPHRSSPQQFAIGVASKISLGQLACTL